MMYGSWTLLGPELKVAAKILCRCACGVERLVSLANMRSGQSTNCGCKTVERKAGREKMELNGESHYLMEWCKMYDLSYSVVLQRLHRGEHLQKALRPIEEKRVARLKCCGCKERFPREQMTKMPVGNFHSTDCIMLYLKEKNAKAKSKRLAKELAEGKQERKSASKAVRDLDRRNVKWQHKQTQPVFNRMRVLQELKLFRDKGIEPTCVSCQKELGGDQWCCGHLKTQGGNPKLRYDERNTFLQHNFSCNMHKSGDIENYRHGIINGPRFKTMDGVATLVHCDNNTGPYKWEWEQLEEMRKQFRGTIRELEAEMDLL